MDGHGGPRFENLGNTVRRKRSQTSRRPRPEAQPFIENRDKSPSSSTPTPPSDDVSKVSSDENTVGDGNSKRKVFHLNQCASTRATGVVGEHAGNKNKNEDGAHNAYGNGGVTSDGLGNENRLKKVKLKVGGVTRTIQTKSNSQGVSSSGVSTKSSRSSDALRQRPKLILQGNSDEDNSPPPDKKSGLQGIPWKDFSRGGFNIGKESSSMGRTSNAFGNQGEKSERVRKSKRVPKKRALDAAFDEDEDDDEIRYLEKLKTSKVAIKEDEESSLKHRSLSRVSKDGKRLKSERVPEDMDYEEEEEHVSDLEVEGKKKLSDSPTESRREMALTTRQRALLGKDGSSASGAGSIEFPNGLPPPPPRNKKEKLTEVEQQLKKAEAAERRRMQNEKAARESEAEAIRKILGQDSSRKKREDKMKKRQEEIAQERAANAHMVTPNTVRTVMGPQGTVVTFSNDVGLPHIFDQKPCSYPPPREKCAGPSCTNPYKYRDSKSKLPLCSLKCYKVIHENMHAETAC